MTAELRNVKAHVDAPQVVEVPPRKKKLEVAVRADLRNTGEDAVVLHAASEEAEVFWHVLDEGHQEIQRSLPLRKLRPAGGEVEEFRSLTLAGGHGVHLPKTLELDASRLQAGRSYIIRAEIWGHVAESRFTVIRPPAPPAKRKAAAKKPSAKKPAGKRAAAKKAAVKVAGAGKPTAGKATGKKPAARKAAAKKPAARKPAAKKPSPKKAAVKVAGAGQPTAGKAAGEKPAKKAAGKAGKAAKAGKAGKAKKKKKGSGKSGKSGKGKKG